MRSRHQTTTLAFGAFLILWSSASAAFDDTTPAKAFATYNEAVDNCDRQTLEKIVHDLPENFYMGPCDIREERKITHIMVIDEVTIELICADCRRKPAFGDHMVYSLQKQPGFDWQRCGHLFRQFDQGWKLLSWSCGDHQ